VDYIDGMTDQIDDPTEIRPLGCVPGGYIDTRNLEEMLRRREVGLWVWDWYSYEDEIRWEKTRAEILANMDPEMRKALGWE
jgi:hypothetical protein